MKTENKQYKLKRWYPSLDGWEVNDIAYYYRNGVYWNDPRVAKHGIPANEVENNPDFWELIEEEKPKPLFITDDGVEISDLCQTVYLIHPKTFIKQKSDLGYFSTNVLDNNKVFYYETNVDEYIWRNMRLFSYNDIEKYQSGGEGVFYDIKAIAKERSEE